MDPDKEEYLKKVYYSPESPASFSGVDKIFQFVSKHSTLKISRADIKEFLQHQENYSDHRQAIKPNKRPRVVASKIGYQWDADLASMQNLSKNNKSFKYFLLAIDVFSKKVFTVPLKTKLPKEVIDAFKKIFNENSPPERLHTDKGREFTATVCLEFYETNNIKHFVTESPIKAGVAERAIKSIKLRLYKAMQARNSYVWIDLLPKITDSYNSTYHSSIKMTPNQVNEQNEPEVWTNLYELENYKNPNHSQNTAQDLKSKSKSKLKEPKKKRYRQIFKFKIGDAVKLAFSRYTFQREYHQRWTTEIFFISSRYAKQNIPMYLVKDFQNDLIKGTFLENELQKVHITDNTEYKIEKIISEKMIRGEKYYLVKWLNYPKKFNTYIKASEITENLNELQ